MYILSSITVDIPQESYWFPTEKNVRSLLPGPFDDCIGPVFTATGSLGPLRGHLLFLFVAFSVLLCMDKVYWWFC